MRKQNILIKGIAALILVAAFDGCTQLEERINDVSSRVEGIESVNAAALEKQLAAMGESLDKLGQTDAELKDYIKTLQGTADALRKSVSDNDAKISELEKNLDQAIRDSQNSDSSIKGELEQQITAAKADVLEQFTTAKTAMESRLEQTESTITELQIKDAELEKKISDLKAYVDNGIDSAKDWASATFATLEQYNSIISDISGIRGSIEKLESSIKSLENNLSKNVAQAVEDAVAPVRDQMISDAAAAVVASYTETVASVRSEMEKLSSRVKNLEDDVKLIKDDIDKIKQDIEEINEKLGSQLGNGIQSIVFVPYSSDGRAYMYRTKEGTNQVSGEITLRFEVQPAEMAEKLVQSWETSLKLKAFYSTVTGATGDGADLSIKSVYADNGTLAVTASGADLSEAFYINQLFANVRLIAGIGGKEKKSDYVPIVPLQGKINIPDIYLKSYLVENYDTDRDGEISEAEALDVKEIDVSPSIYSVRTLSGIEYFTNLESLNCSGNRIEEVIDLFYNGKLKYLNCSDNSISGIRLEHNPSVVMLSCYGNPITLLDICGCAKLSSLFFQSAENAIKDGISINIDNYSSPTNWFFFRADGTPFVKFSFTNAPEVTMLDLTGDFTDIDVSGNKAMEDCSVSRFANLENLNVSGCNFGTVDVSSNTKLKVLNCSGNDIRAIDVKTNTLLEELNISGNESVTSVDVSTLSNLSVLDVSGCSLKSVDVTKNPGLKSFKCSGNDLSSVNVRRNSLLKVLDVSDNNNMSAIDVWDNLELEELYASGLGISELDLTENTQLKVLDVSNNGKLAEVEVSSPECLYRVFAKNDASTKFVDSAGQTLYWGSEIEIDGTVWAGYNAGASRDDVYGNAYTFDNAVKACPNGWRTPRKANLQALSSHSSPEVTVNGVKGCWFSGSKAYSASAPAIFLPYLNGYYGAYWSSTYNGSSFAYYLSFSSSSVYMDDYGDRSTSYSVRCLKK